MLEPAPVAMDADDADELCEEYLCAICQQLVLDPHTVLICPYMSALYALCLPYSVCHLPAARARPSHGVPLICLMCLPYMPYMSALDVCLRCAPTSTSSAARACLLCLPYMLYMSALIVTPRCAPTSTSSAASACASGSTPRRSARRAERRRWGRPPMCLPYMSALCVCLICRRAVDDAQVAPPHRLRIINNAVEKLALRVLDAATLAAREERRAAAHAADAMQQACPLYVCLVCLPCMSALYVGCLPRHPAGWHPKS